jgi:hypothetical protein
VVEGGGIFGWDEAHQDMDARMSMQLANVLLSQTLMFFRKIQMPTLITAQDTIQLDKRTRSILNFRRYCEGAGTKDSRSHRVTTMHFRTARILGTESLLPEEAKRWHSVFNTFEFTRRLKFPTSLAQFEVFMLELEEAAAFARSYTGEPRGAWAAFGVQSGHTKGKAAASGEKVPSRSHVRKNAGRAAGAGRGPRAGDGVESEGERGVGAAAEHR